MAQTFQAEDPLKQVFPNPLQRMRRFELMRLADAYGIPYPPNPTKKQLLPTLEAAQQAGQFHEAPPHPEKLLPLGQRGKQKVRVVKWNGPHHKFAIFETGRDEPVAKGFQTKEEAEAFMKDM